MTSTLEPAILSCDTGQRMPCFDSCHLTTKWISNIKYHAYCKVQIVKLHCIGCIACRATLSHVRTRELYAFDDDDHEKCYRYGAPYGGHRPLELRYHSLYYRGQERFCIVGH